MATLISIGFVELLKWISGLLTSARVVLKALVYNPLVEWALRGLCSPLPKHEMSSAWNLVSNLGSGCRWRV
jgi:hypothetical protein